MEVPIANLTDCISKRWLFSLNDPDPSGWTITGLYAVVAIAALAAFRHTRSASESRRQPALWGFIALVLAGLAVNKQLDLQSLVTAAGRCLAQAQGWYEIRRTVQLDFILVLLLATAILACVMIWLLRGTLRRNALALTGLGTVGAFVLIRAMHFYHLLDPESASNDRALRLVTGTLELLGPILILAAALKAVSFSTQHDDF